MKLHPLASLLFFGMTFAVGAAGESGKHESMLADAVGEPSEVKPAFEADLSEVDRSGNPVASSGKSRLILNREGTRFVSFSYVENFALACPPNAICAAPPARQAEFTIYYQWHLGCGSTRYYAFSRKPGNGNEQTELLIVNDHSQQTCGDTEKAGWEAVLRSTAHAQRYFLGNPKAIPEPGMDCSQVMEGGVCTMLYLPATCVLHSVDGVALTTEIAAEGSNECFANYSLKAAACGQGIDFDEITDDDVTCSVHPEVTTCPTRDCAAPPANCRYDSSRAPKDSNGCFIGCGPLVCQ